MPTQEANELEVAMAAMINAERAEAGLAPLALEMRLNHAAQEHSGWMARTATLSHEGDGGSSPTDRIRESGFDLSGSWSTRENVGYVSLTGALDETEVELLHESLMASEGHRANILDPDVTYIGIGLSVGGVTYQGDLYQAVFVTQNFARTDAEVMLQDDDTPVDPEDPVDPVDPEDPEDPEEETPRDESSGSGGGCFVATAAYGTRNHPDVVAMRQFRDETLVRTMAGRALVRGYWRIGPVLARHVRSDAASGAAVRAVVSRMVRRR